MEKTERSLADILGANYSHNRNDVIEKKDDITTKDVKDLPDEESKKFLAELEGDSAEIADIKSLDELLINPLPGSVILAFKDPNRRSKSHILKFATDSFLPNIAPILFSDDIPLEMYVIFRLVLPHKKALAVAEKIGALAKENKMTPAEVLNKISNLDIKNRGDIKKVIMKALNYHPHIGSVLGSFLSRISVKGG